MVAAEVANVHKRRYQSDPMGDTPALRALIEEGLAVEAADYQRATAVRERFREAVGGWMEAVDVLLLPTVPAPAPADLSNDGDSSFQAPWTFCGVPSLSLPSGLSRDGMPFGIQIVGKYLEDEHLLAIAGWCESVLDVDLCPPGIG
jgi:Asp-tRNA(Asn)/Glu-tRNA(Gln) amidotransferase A subunit family amidase